MGPDIALDLDGGGGRAGEGSGEGDREGAREHVSIVLARRSGGEEEWPKDGWLAPERPISADGFVQRAGIAALSKAGDAAVDRMRQFSAVRRKAMAELMRGVGFGIPVMPRGASYVFADASRYTDDSCQFAFDLLEKAGVGVAPGVDFGQAGRRAVRFRYTCSGKNIRGTAQGLGEEMRKKRKRRNSRTSLS